MKRSPFNPSGEAPVDERLDPAIQAELDQLDAALRGEPIQDDLLATLVRDVQATAPEMPSDLRKQLRHDVATGFERRGTRGRISAALGRTGNRQAGGRPRGSKLLTGGSLAAVAAAGVFAMVVINSGSDDLEMSEIAQKIDQGSSGDSATPPDSERFANQDPSLASEAPSSAPVTPASGDASEAAASGGSSSPTSADLQARSADPSALLRGLTPATGERKVEQSVEMRVRVKSGELDDASQKVETIVRQGGGYVADSRVSLGTRGSGNALFSLKVDSTKLDATMQRLADLGTVTRQQQASRDITSSFDSVQRRLDDNAELRKALLRALAKAETGGEIASLKRRLADNRSSRASLERQLAQLKTRTDLTDLELSLRAPSSGSAVDEDDDGSWSIGDALSDAGKALGTVTGVLLVGGAVFLPFALLGAAGWAVYRVRRKRRRESALDG